MCRSKFSATLFSFSLPFIVYLSYIPYTSAESMALQSTAKLKIYPKLQAQDIKTLPKGIRVNIIAQGSNWFKVSYNGHSGFVLREHFEDYNRKNSVASNAQLKNATTRTRPKVITSLNSQTDNSVNPDATITISQDVVLRKRPSYNSNEFFKLNDNSALKVIMVRGEWVAVVDKSGTTGWVNKQDIISQNNHAASKTSQSTASVNKSKQIRRSGRAVPNRSIFSSTDENLNYQMGANLGLVAKTQDFESTGNELASNYIVSNTVPAVVINGMFLKKLGEFLLGAEGSFYSTVSGRLDANDPLANSQDALGWSVAGTDLRALAAFRMNPKYLVTGRIGYHVSKASVDTDAVFKLPSETLSGVTVGAGLLAPKMSPNISGSAGIEVLVSGSLDQTAGLKDGDNIDVNALYFNAVAQYQWKTNISWSASYQFSNEKFNFAGPSERNVGLQQASRKDIQHVVSVGLSYIF